LERTRERLEEDPEYQKRIIYLKNKTQEEIKKKIVGKKVAVKILLF